MVRGLFSLPLLYASLAQPIVINEVMPNPEGPESEVCDKNEFIELYNSGDGAIDVSGFYLECGASPGVREDILTWEDTLLIDTNVVIHTAIIPAGGYAVLLPRGYTDSSAYSQPYRFSEHTVILTVSTKYFGQNGLATTHHIWLFDSLGQLIDSYGSPEDSEDGIPLDPGDGISVEKIDPAGGDTESNWAASLHESGSTPGMRNSVSRMHNLSIFSEDISFFPSRPMVGSNCEVSVTPGNTGREWASGFLVTVFADENLDFVSQPDELIGSLTVTDSLEPLYGQSSVSFLWTALKGGDYRIVVDLDYQPDEDTSDNRAYRYLRVGAPLPQIIINEIMYDPLAGEPQWIELYNRSPYGHALTDFKICDSDTETFYVLPEVVVQPGGYLVVAASDSGLPPSLAEDVVVPENGFPYLNKSDDLISLLDGTGFVFERIHYVSSMGGGSGISLERISPEVSGNQSANWGSSVDSDGATPGARNSLWASPSETSGSLRSSPNPFFPNGDGEKDFTIVSYSLPYRLSKLRLTVYDVKGRQVKSVAEDLWTASEGNLIWDGRNEDGALVASGVYILYLEATDTESARAFAEKTTVVLGRR